MSHFSLQNFGLGKTAAAPPVTVAAGSVGVLIVPGLGGLTAVRGAESVFRNSLFRSSYELFYTLVPEVQKRSAKSLIDVGFERVGDVSGGLMIRLLLFLGPALSQIIILLCALGSAVIGIIIAFRLQKGYVAILEQSLFKQVRGMGPKRIWEKLEQPAFLTTMGSLGLDSTLGRGRMIDESSPIAGSQDSGSQTSREFLSEPLELAEKALQELQSGDPTKIRKWLASESVPPPNAIPYLFPLLALDEVYIDLTRLLMRAGDTAIDPLITAFLMPDRGLAVRRRIPRTLSLYPLPKVVEALMSGFESRRFEIRYQRAVGLARIKAQTPDPET